MKSELFQHEVRKTSTVFGRKEDVSVSFQGTDAMTDGNHIILPAMDFESDITDEEASIIRGYTDHEAGHIRHTNFRAIERMHKKEPKNKLWHQLQNAIEDIFLEKRVISEYEGAKDNLVATSKCVNEQFLEACVEKEGFEDRMKSRVWISPVAITWEGRKHYGDNSANECLEKLPAELRTDVERWTSEIDKCKKTQDVIDLAKKIELEIREKEEEDPTTPPPTTPTDGEGSPEGECPPEGKTDKPTEERPTEKEDEEGKGKAKIRDEEEETSEGGEPKDEEGGGEASKPEDKPEEPIEDSVYEDFDYENAVKKVKDAHDPTSSEVRTDKNNYSAMTTAHDKWHHRTDEVDKYGRCTQGTTLAMGTAGKYDKILETMSGDVNLMRRKLEKALLAKQNRDWDFGKEMGRLDSKRFTSAVVGKPNVFKMKTDRREMDTAVCLLVDLSASMGGSKIFLAQQCAMAIAEAIDRTGIKYEILGFTTSECQSTKLAPRCKPKDYHRYTRYESIEMYIFKHFKERLFEAKGAIAQISRVRKEENVDGESVAYAYSRLKERNEKRKVLMVLSDGAPACHTYNVSQLRNHLERTVAKIDAEPDVTVVGIGIADTNVERYYPKHIVVNSVESLATEAMGELSSILLGERLTAIKRTA